ncbi:hypothetical protein H8F23_00600 [Pseudomonas sp. P155]|uniref:Uncharacterized protein n=1 Tax=Pseudomonas neuropathica TaxID=2730425 RepID=A0ABS0BB65_9PSED|nr:hypothetical protein [Pseudomonas neuropathica]MBF6031741.1 hypothetical protein [Pseudomonas neuropathica]
MARIYAFSTVVVSPKFSNSPPLRATTGVPAIFITLLEAEERRMSSTLKNCMGCSEFPTGPESGFAAKNRYCPLPATPFGEPPS